MKTKIDYAITGTDLVALTALWAMSLIVVNASVEAIVVPGIGPAIYLVYRVIRHGKRVEA